MEQRESDQRQQPAREGERAKSSGAYLPLLTGGPIVALSLVSRCWRSRLA